MKIQSVSEHAGSSAPSVPSGAALPPNARSGSPAPEDRPSAPVAFLDEDDTPVSDGHVRLLDDGTLRRAIKHHRRAIEALAGISFSGVSEETSRRLIERMQHDLQLFESELSARRPEAQV